MRRALILDLDFTVLHLEAVPDSIEVPGRTRSAWIAPRTVEILGDLQAIFDIVLATARSWDGTKWVVDGLQSRGVEVTALILEDGARLGTSNNLRAFERSLDMASWRKEFECFRMRGPEFEWQLDFENCFVARCENGETGERLRELWESEWSGSDQLRFFRDGRKVYALPAGANKWSALRQMLGENALLAAGVGDGANDLVWLPQIAFPATFARANPFLVEAVRAKGGYITILDGHKGIADILERWL